MAFFTKIPFGVLLLFSNLVFGHNSLSLGRPGPTMLNQTTSHLTAFSDTLTGIINIYTPVTGFGCDSSIVLVGAADGFQVGNRVLLIQMQGAKADLTDSPQFGSLTDLSNTGNYEFNRIDAISGNTIYLKYALKKNYQLEGKVQLITVPEYDNVQVGALTCAPWNGSTGGILALEVKNVLQLTDNIDVSGLGFRGGAAVDAAALSFQELHYFYPPNAVVAGAKGEGVAIIPLQQSYGRGNIGNGGGGGNAHNAGGGGGANGGAGGQGGLDYYLAPNLPTPGTNGLGGTALSGDVPDKIILGGGGGAGHVNDNAGSSGGHGGGIIFLKAQTVVGNHFYLRANGLDVTLPPDINAKDGQGGGGAGGTILIETNQMMDTLYCEALGGKGGNCFSLIPTESHGPGGGGSGGQIRLSSNFNNVFASLNGGVNGQSNLGNPNGAEPGANGQLLLNQHWVYATKIAKPQPTITKTIAFCPGTTLSLFGQNYSQPDTITALIPSTTTCDTLATYILQFKPQATSTQEIFFCKGDSVLLDGVYYHTPQTIVRNIALPGACDSVATIFLKYTTPNNQTSLQLNCPAAISIDVAPNTNSALVNYLSPTAASDCTCPGIDLRLKKGLPSGSVFPLGVTELCFEAKDSCGQERNCCFTVNVSDGQACDVKTLACLKFELLSIKQNAQAQYTYTIRLNNQCSQKLLHIAFELPKSLLASAPATNTIYTAPSGRTYRVRNPNASPAYSIRFAALSDSIANGQSDVFQYTLPAIANVLFIHAFVRLESQIYYDTYLNVFGCDVTFAPDNPIAERQTDQENALVFPNPTSGRLYTDLSAWNTESVQLRIYNIHGMLILQTTQTAESARTALDLPLELPDGLYLLEIMPTNGQAVVQKFVLQR